jgi:hypothetical protein
MKAAKWRGLLVVVLLMLIGLLTTAANSRMTMEQEGAHHILLSAEDFSSVGDALTVIGPDWTSISEDSNPTSQLLSGWLESVTTTLIVDSAERGQEYAIVSLSSYRFESTTAVQDQLHRVDVLLEENGVQPSRNEIPTDSESAELLNRQATSWLMRSGRDDENLLAYLLWIQLDIYVLETYIAVDDLSAPFGQQLMRHIIQHLLTGEAASTAHGLPDTVARRSLPDAPIPQAWLTSRANRTLERSGIHFLAV